MVKKNKNKNLGKALIKDRFGTNRRRHINDSQTYLHSADLQNGNDWDHLNLKSVTEESSFQEFIATAELAGKEFQAEKLNVRLVNSKTDTGLLSNEEHKNYVKLQETYKTFIKIPRRPKWDKTMTGDELQNKEVESFLEWRKELALLQEMKGFLLTPYEKNLEFWRQLWRVVERSDVVAQIVDARNPLLFRCTDLEKYANEVNPDKINMILINKADFLTQKQREIWADYFTKKNLRVAFFSATESVKNSDAGSQEESSKTEESESAAESVRNTDDLTDEQSSSTEDDDDEENVQITNNPLLEESSSNKTNTESVNSTVNDESKSSSETVESTNTETEKIENLHLSSVSNSSDLLSREELIALFRTIHPKQNFIDNVLTIGLVGYPNVGKSSTINALLMDKKVSVSATPGKTKHFQTLYLDKDLLLCDCPGLVMPNFVNTKAEMILNGILPINQMKDHVPPMNLLGTLIPRHIIENLYGILIPLPNEGEDLNRPPNSEEILNAHGFNRGFMTQNGQPDNARSARYILKDFVTGKLLHCTAPPGYSQSEFHTFPAIKKKTISEVNLPPRAIRVSRTLKPTTDDIDKKFFQNYNSGVHVRGKGTTMIQADNNSSISGSVLSLGNIEKPWKKLNKHTNKKKREKTRRLYAHLDKR